MAGVSGEGPVAFIPRGSISRTHFVSLMKAVLAVLYPEDSSLQHQQSRVLSGRDWSTAVSVGSRAEPLLLSQMARNHGDQGVSSPMGTFPGSMCRHLLGCLYYL